MQTLWRPATPQLYVDVDREKAKALGVPLSELYGALAATLGNYYVNDFNKFGRTWQVLMAAEPEFRKSPDSVGDLYVRSDKGEMIPLRSLANVRYASGPDSLTRFNNLPAVFMKRSPTTILVSTLRSSQGFCVTKMVAALLRK